MNDRNTYLTDYQQPDSMIKVNRGWMENVLRILEGRKNGNSKKILTNQIKKHILKSQNRVKIKEENGSLQPLVKTE